MSWTHYHVCFKSPLDYLKSLTQCHVSCWHTVLLGQQRQQPRSVDAVQMQIFFPQLFVLYSRLHLKIQNLWVFKANAAFVSLTHLNTLIQKLVLRSEGSAWICFVCCWRQPGVWLLIWSGSLPGNKVNSSIWSSVSGDCREHLLLKLQEWHLGSRTWFSSPPIISSCDPSNKFLFCVTMHRTLT